MGTSLLLLIATILSLDGATARIQTGMLDGLHVGDEGTIYYELLVADQTRRIEVGPATVLRVGVDWAECSVPAEVVRPGFLVSFEIPVQRSSPSAIAQQARIELQGEPLERALSALAERMIPSGSRLESEILRILESRTGAEGQVAAVAVAAASKPAPQRDTDTPGPKPATAEPEASTTGMVPVAAGSHLVGLDLQDADFYSQTPRFRVQLTSFWIDRSLVTTADFAGSSATGDRAATSVSYSEADAHCRSKGKQLPSELQWEVAVTLGLVERQGLEWTTSWYKPYPGNEIPETEFGERFKVLRGDISADDFSPHRRRFAPPPTRHPQLGFRCVLLLER